MRPLRVAVVGTGPAGAYTAAHLLRAGVGAELELLDRLPTPWGLVRAGVAPDHQDTKAITRSFDWVAADPAVRLRLDVDVGRDVTHEELLQCHDAVVYAVGAGGSRRLGLPGEELPGSLAATDVVAWYNGHPAAAGLGPDLSHERAVVVGNGNVALDVARVLVRDVEALRRTDIADHALDALAGSAVREVVVLGRRGPAQAAFTSPELRALLDLEEVDVVVEPADAVHAALDEPLPADPARAYGVRLKVDLLREALGRRPRAGRRRIVLRFFSAPSALVGSDRVEGLEVERTAVVAQADGSTTVAPRGVGERLPAGLVVRAIGYAAQAVPGLPFDPAAAIVRNVAGRVEGRPGTYVAGWVKRGPSGVIGTNKRCAAQTVRALLDDLGGGARTGPQGGRGDLEELLAARRPEAIGLAGWRAIDAHETTAGRRQGRPRVKLADLGALRAVAAGASTPTAQATA
ncbi:MAG TPA: FAD-dependent oxidoreductase [Baekduia sp.]|nr:FAD-dependent oxidoreductase [Baekduia sp.]